jgi:hypothetical protein
MNHETITLHIEMSDHAFAGYIKHGTSTKRLSEEGFQALVETLAATATTADHIMRDFAASTLATEGMQA